MHAAVDDDVDALWHSNMDFLGLTIMFLIEDIRQREQRDVEEGASDDR